MKIIHVIDYFQPKLGYQETFLAKKHAEAGHDVFVVTSDRFQPFLYKGNAAPVMGDRIKGPGFSSESGIQVWRLKVRFEFPNVIWLSGLGKKIREIKPDLVIVHGVTNLSAVRIAAMKNRGGKFRLIFDDHATEDNSRGTMRVLYPFFRWTLSNVIQKAADGFVAILPATKDFMRSKYGIKPFRIRVIPMGADTSLFYYDGECRQEIRKKFNYSHNDVVFIYTGKVIPSRQVDVLIDAVSILVKKYNNIKVFVVGSSEEDYLAGLKQLIEQKGLTSVFSWIPAVSNGILYQYYSAADVSVWPSGASIGMREAMASELPIIIGENSLVTELIEADNGLTFKEGDASDLADKMKKLLDMELRKKMGKKGRKLVEEKFNWESIAKQFLEIIK